MCPIFDATIGVSPLNFAPDVLHMVDLDVADEFVNVAMWMLILDGTWCTARCKTEEEILKQLQQKSVNCKDVTFKIFGLSLTTFNLLISFLLTIFLVKRYFEYGKNKQKKN